MLLAAWRDLQWRRRRFLIAVLGTALVFAMTLVLAGLSAAFVNEVDRTIDDHRRRRVGDRGRCDRAVQLVGRAAGAALAAVRATARRGRGRSVRRDRRDDPGRHAEARDDDRRGPGRRRQPEGRRRPRAPPRGEIAVGEPAGQGHRRHASRSASKTLQVVGTGPRSGLLRRHAERVPHARGRAGADVRRCAALHVDRGPRPSAARHAAGNDSIVTIAETKNDLLQSLGSGRQTINFVAVLLVDRRRVHRRLGDLPLRARAGPRLRGVQGDRHGDAARCSAGSRCRP